MSTFNRFAGLLIESDEEQKLNIGKRDLADTQKTAAKKRKNRKKKSQKSTNQQKDTPDTDVWREHDEQLVSEMFHNDLKKALEQSKLEYEENNQFKSNSNTDINEMGDGKNHSKKENIKKNKTMPLETFLQVNGDSEKQNTSFDKSKKINSTGKSNEKNFFNDVEREAAAIKRQEEKILSFKKTLNKEKEKKKLTYKELVDMCSIKDKHVEGLENCVDLWKLKFEKLKNKYDHLQAVVKKGELKEKCKLVLEVEKLTNIQNELTEEVEELNINLEQEKSKNRKLKEELLRIQGKKEQRTLP